MWLNPVQPMGSTSIWWRLTTTPIRSTINLRSRIRALSKSDSFSFEMNVLAVQYSSQIEFVATGESTGKGTVMNEWQFLEKCQVKRR